ncbi:T9SS type A sorting domain-containing protein [candidate division KSB1 bacterium]|nr:T9SS type A sorting domain-containing protein [candidate division KSB1 bacterium]
MRRSMVVGIIFFIVSDLFAQYPVNFNFVAIPNPLSGTNPVYLLAARDVPVPGQPFFDASFGAQITRVTTTDYIHGRHEYSRFDPFNSDKSMIILDPDVRWNIYSTQTYPYNQASQLVRTIDLEEPRWDPNDKNLIWGTLDFSIQQINVATGEITVIKDFSRDPVIGPLVNQGNVYRITMKDEGESSIDKRYWAFFLQGNEQVDYNHVYMFTWDRVNDDILGVYKLSASETSLDWIGMSPLGNWVLIGGDYDNGGNLAGLTMANKELTQFHRLDYGIAHSDVGLDVYGNEVIVMQNTMTDYIDLIPIDLKTQPILEAGGSYDNTNRTTLVRLYYAEESPYGLHSGIHVACNAAGYCLISTYTEPGLPEQNWLDRTIILIKLDPEHPQARYLAKVYNTSGSYWEETHATMSNDGSRLVWASNWGQQVGNEQVFLMQLDMPVNWDDIFISVPEWYKDTSHQFSLLQNYPNPFNSQTIISYSLSHHCLVDLEIYNILAEKINTLHHGYQSVGMYTIRWDATDNQGHLLPGGLYICRLKTDNSIQTRKFLFIK